MQKVPRVFAGLWSNLRMSKPGYSYRRKSGNCNKPFRNSRDQRSRGSGARGGPIPGTSRDVSPRRGEFAGARYVSGNRSSGQTSRTGHRNYSSDEGKKVNDEVAGARNVSVYNGPDEPPQPSNRKCPSHLKGREIGLWFKDMRRREEPREEVMEIYVDHRTQDFMERYLSSTSHLVEDENDFSLLAERRDFETFEEKINAQVFNPKEQNVYWDMRLYREHAGKKNQPDFMKMNEDREKLPVFKKCSEILKLIDKHQVSVISGGTGCGKTTQIVQYVLDDFIMKRKGSLCNIVCTQPRRISAVSVAERVAAERNEPLTVSVGYQIRLDSKLAEKKCGCINFVTTGILLQWLMGDPILENVSHLFLDEVHERTVECDTVMALLKYILPKRPDLKVILMSATVNAQSFANYFVGAPCFEIPGFTYPVREIFLEDIVHMTSHKFREVRKPTMEASFKDFVVPYVRDLERQGLYSRSVTRELMNPLSEELDISLIVQVVRYICLFEEEGAVLVFLPGLTDLTNLNRELMKQTWFSHDKYVVVIVHSMLPSVEQKDAFMIPPRGKRKIIIATSILETSVTVNDISYVVDCGKKKLSGYDLKHNVATLLPSWISLANAQQRSGRAGRTKPGKCYKLYTRIRQDIFDKYPTPEIQTTSLEQIILEAKALKLQRVAPFLEKMMDPPDREMVALSLKVLRNLNALDGDERLTPLGYHLSQLPMDPRTGKMILMAALFSCIDPIFSIAACLTFRDPFSIPLGQEDAVVNIKEHFAKGETSDHIIYSEILKQWENEHYNSRYEFSYRNFLSNHTLNLLSEMKRQFAEILHSMNFLPSPNVKDRRSNVNSENKPLLKAIICAGLYPNVAILKSNKKEAILRTVDNRSVRFHMKSYCSHVEWFESPFFVYHYKLKSTSIFIHDASMINPLPLLLFGRGLRISEKDRGYYIEVDEFLKFKISRRSGYLIKRLRDRLDMTIAVAVINSEGFNWQEAKGKSEILNGIVELITMNTFQHKIYKPK